MGRKFGGGLRPLFGEGEQGPHLAQSRLAEAYLHAKYHLDPSRRFDNKLGPKIWGLRPLFGEGERGPHLTQSRLGRGIAPCRVAS